MNISSRSHVDSGGRQSQNINIRPGVASVEVEWDLFGIVSDLPWHHWEPLALKSLQLRFQKDTKTSFTFDHWKANMAFVQWLFRWLFVTLYPFFSAFSSSCFLFGLSESSSKALKQFLKLLPASQASNALSGDFNTKALFKYSFFLAFYFIYKYLCQYLSRPAQGLNPTK